MKALPYREGSWFCVPLRGGGYAVGVVARMRRNGKIVLLYLFGPRRDTVPMLSEVITLRPHEMVECVRAGDLGLVNGDWPVLGETSDWDRTAWPMPTFVRRDELAKRAWKVVYSDDDPSQVEREERAPYDIDLEADALWGYGAMELKLTKLLD